MGTSGCLLGCHDVSRKQRATTLRRQSGKRDEPIQGGKGIFPLVSCFQELPEVFWQTICDSVAAMQEFFNQLLDAKMHVGDLAQLSCLLAIYPPDLRQSPKDCLEEQVAQYWSASRDRIDRWQFHLHSFVENPNSSPHQKTAANLSLETRHPDEATLGLSAVPLMVEIILSEPLTRVWAAIFTGSAQNLSCRQYQNDRAHYGSVPEHIVRLHHAIRQETMGRLEGIVTDATEREYLENLARRTLRWTDLLLAHTEQSYAASRFAPDPERCLEFAEDLQMQMQSQQQHTAVLTIASARQAICEELPTCAFSEQLNFRIGSAVLQSCGSNDLDILGLLDPLWTTRLFATLAHCEGLLKESLNDPPAMPLPCAH